MLATKIRSGFPFESFLFSYSGIEEPQLQTLLSRYKKDIIVHVILLDEARRHLDYFLVSLRVGRAARRRPDEPRIV